MMSEVSFSLSILDVMPLPRLMHKILTYAKDPVHWTNGGSWIATPTPHVAAPIVRWPPYIDTAMRRSAKLRGA